MQLQQMTALQHRQGLVLACVEGRGSVPVKDVLVSFCMLASLAEHSSEGSKVGSHVQAVQDHCLSVGSSTPELVHGEREALGSVLPSATSSLSFFFQF